MSTDQIQMKTVLMAVEKFGTQENVARLLGTSQVQISRYVNGQQSMSMRVFQKIVKILGGKIHVSYN